MNQAIDIDIALARKVLSIVDAGLVGGLGSQEPGKMCVEAAVCAALGLPHGDGPPCVGSAVRAFKIRLNDAHWSSNEARAAGMRDLAVAQLGSNEIDQVAFVRALGRETIRLVVPEAMRLLASRVKDADERERCESAANACESEPTVENSRRAQTFANSLRRRYAAAAYAAADAAADAAYAAAAYAAADAVAVAAAYAAAYAADQLLRKGAEAGLLALRECGSPGVKLLDEINAT